MVRQPFRIRSSPTTNPAIANHELCEVRALRFGGVLFHIDATLAKKKCRLQGLCGLRPNLNLDFPAILLDARLCNLRFELNAQAAFGVDNLFSKTDRREKACPKISPPQVRKVRFGYQSGEGITAHGHMFWLASALQ